MEVSDGLSYPTMPGDVDHLIVNDHAVMNRLFEHLEAGRGDRRVLADPVCFEVAEHAEVKRLVKMVESDQPGEPGFERALDGIIADIRVHAHEEEDGPERMAELGQEFIAAKRTAPTYSHPAGPSSKLGHKLVDAGAAVVDAVMKILEGDGKPTDPSQGGACRT